MRIISLTNRDLKQRMQQDMFREDLYCRLNGVAIRLPPLQERNGDCALLIQYLLKRFVGQMNENIGGMAPAAMRTLSRYHWPGSIPEWANTMGRAVLLAEGGTITTEDLNLFSANESTVGADDTIRLRGADVPVEDAERELVLQALQRSSWVREEDAELPWISSSALTYKIKRFGISHSSGKQNR